MSRRLVLSVAVLVFASAFGGTPGGRSAPEPGSPADRYCDTNSTGAGTVMKGGKLYDEECLNAYP